MKTQKDVKTVLLEYIDSLNDDELHYLGARLVEKYSGDLADALNFMSNKAAMDHVLSSTTSADELYQICDLIGEILSKEAKKRNINLLAVPMSSPQVYLKRTRK